MANCLESFCMPCTSTENKNCSICAKSLCVSLSTYYMQRANYHQICIRIHLNLERHSEYIYNSAIRIYIYRYQISGNHLTVDALEALIHHTQKKHHHIIIVYRLFVLFHIFFTLLILSSFWYIFWINQNERTHFLFLPETGSKLAG